MLVLNLVVLALAITLEPIPFTAFAVVLASEGGVTKAAFFISGWILSLAVMVAIALAATRTTHRGRARRRPPPAWPSRSDRRRTARRRGSALARAASPGRRRIHRNGRPASTGCRSGSPSPCGPLVQLGTGGGRRHGSRQRRAGNSFESSPALVLFCVLSTATYLAAKVYAWVRPEGRGGGWRRCGHGSAAVPTRSRRQSGVVGLWLIVDSVYVLVS